MNNENYNEYSMGALFNVVTGYNGFADFDEVTELLTYINGSEFPKYQLIPVWKAAKRKIELKNIKFIDEATIELNNKINELGNIEEAINLLLSDYQKEYGETILVSRKGELKRKEINKVEEVPAVKKIVFASNRKIG